MSSLRSRNRLSLPVLLFGLREALLHALNSRIPKRDPSLVSPNVSLIEQFLHQASRMLPRAPDKLSNFRRRLLPLVRQESQNLKLTRSRDRVQRTRLDN